MGCRSAIHGLPVPLPTIKDKPASASAPPLPCILPTNLQALVPTNQYKYSFLLEDETAPRHVLNCVLDTSIPVPVKDLFAVSPDIYKHFHNLTTVKHIITTTPATMVTIHINELASHDPSKVECDFSDCILHNNEGTIVTHHSLLLHTIEVKLGPLGVTILFLGSTLFLISSFCTTSPFLGSLSYAYHHYLLILGPLTFAVHTL